MIRRACYALIGIIGLPILLFRGYGPYYVNLSPGTESGGPVSIATDHSHYREYEAVHLTVTNRSPVPIYTVYFPDRNCTIYLVAQLFVTAQWWAVDHAGSCPNPAPTVCQGALIWPRPLPVSHPNTVVKINPGADYSASWWSRVPYGWGGFDGAGPARILFVYSTDQQTISALAMMPGSNPLDVPGVNNTQVGVSATLRIEDDGYRPPTPGLCA
jgi:hypothetical protein